jgi:tetratricopeptide (TPR) repeat protein
MVTPLPRSSWKAKLDRLNCSSFIGRRTQLATFRNSLADPETQANIVAVSGQGGVGKTTLLKEFRRIAEKQGKNIVAYVDEGSLTNPVEDVPEALHRLAHDFEAQNSNYKFEKFQELYKTYRQKRQELAADPEAPSGIASSLSRVGLKLALGGMKVVPGMGEMMDEFVDSDALAEKGGEWVSFALKKFRNRDEVQLVIEPLEVLTPLFLEEINRMADSQTVVLLLDTYEVTRKFWDDWLRAVLELRYGEDLTANFILCIAGRDPLDRNAWSQLEGCIARSDLEPFTETEACQFLMEKGIKSEAVISEIWKLSSGGLPSMLAMMAQNAPTNVEVIVDPCESAVERFLKWVSDAEKRMIAQNAALPRLLNRDVLAVVTSNDEADLLFDWLKSQSFVVEHPDGWQYHPIVREQMLRHQRRVSPQRWETLHEKLADYYNGLRQSLDLEASCSGKNEQWQKYSLEWLYHSLCMAPQKNLRMALDGWLFAVREQQEKQQFDHAWANVMASVGEVESCAELRHWGNQIQMGVQSCEEKRYKPILEVLSLLLKDFQLEDRNRATALVQQAMIILLDFLNHKNATILSKLSEYDDDRDERFSTPSSPPNWNSVIKSLDEAINLDSKEAEYLVLRGIVKRYAGLIQASRLDFDDAIKLDKKSEEFIAGFESSIETFNEFCQQSQRLLNELKTITEKLHETLSEVQKKGTSSELTKNVEEQLTVLTASLQEIQCVCERLKNNIKFKSAKFRSEAAP